MPTSGPQRWERPAAGSITVLCVVWALHGAAAAHAGEARFSIDRTKDLTELARTGRVAVSVDRVGGVYTLDASAILRVDARRLLDVSLAYERYANIGVPNLRASHVVSGAPGSDVLQTWSWMSCMGQSSKHYLTVHVARSLAAPGSAGIRWELASRQASWPYEDAPAFRQLDGSWYLEPLGDDTVYVRYYMVASLESSMPEGLRAWAVKEQLREGTLGVVYALSREATRGR
jgi:hypothetical protein